MSKYPPTHTPDHRPDSSPTILLTNGRVWTGSRFAGSSDILIAGESIVEIGPTGTLSVGSDGDEVHDLGGRLVLPGLVNYHTHLYSSLAPGLTPAGPMTTFPEILRNLWWRLDAVHDEESIYYSALVGAIAHAEAGVTTLFDHHASMSLVDGSLDIVAKAITEVGLRGVLCFETSDRSDNRGDGRVGPGATAHIRENLRFFREHEQDAFFRGTMGLHAALTLSNPTLELVAADRPSIMPIHIHAGESTDDLLAARRDGSSGPVDRLNRHGLLDGRSLLAHAIHLTDRDYEILDQTRPAIITATESNQNNGVGLMAVDRVPSYVLGTDGMGCDMVAALRSHYLALSAAGHGQGRLFTMLTRGGRDVLQGFFPGSGELATGMNADITVLDYVPLTPIDQDSLIPHLVYGAQRAVAHLTLAAGRVIARKGAVATVDKDRILAMATEAATRLHRRFHG